MNVNIKAVHFDMNDDYRDLIDKKLHKVEFAHDMIQDLDITVALQKKEYTLEGQVHFKFGQKAHVELKTFELVDGIDELIDKLAVKIHKEKEKIQDRSEKHAEKHSEKRNEEI